MSGLLTQMAQTSLARLEAARAQESEQSLWSRASDAPPAPPLKLSPEGFDIIAECKLHSPSAGDLSANTTNVEDRVRAYAEAGAAAVSVLTEPSRFGGHLDHLRQAVEVLRRYNVPAMRKDFLVDPYQVMEARAAGAGGVLVIVRMLDCTHITRLLDCATMLKMFVLLEAFDSEDLRVATDLLRARKAHNEQILVGVNCRDLETLKVEFSHFENVVDELPHGYPRVAESGVNDELEVTRVAQIGYQLALVGTSLMNSADPRKRLADLLAAGRRQAMRRRGTSS